MKLLFIYLALVLAIAFYVWVNIVKEGNQATDMASMNNILTPQYTNTPGLGGQSTTEKDTSSDILKSNNISPNIKSIDRYADPMCKPNEYLYCVDGQIECNDIFGGKMNKLQGMGQYISGNTLAGCGSYINKVNLSDYSTQIGTINTKGVYFDLSNCTNAKPWRVGGNNGIPIKGCFESELYANNAWNTMIDLSLNMNAIYNVNDDVFVLESFLNTQTTKGLPQILKVLETTKNASNNAYTTINGRKYFYAKIIAVTGNTYTITISSINVENVPKIALLKDSLYNPITNDYYSNLKTGSKPRPVCKSGAFTSCLSSPPFTMKNGVYVSTNDPTLTVYADGSDPTQKQIQTQIQTPFSSAPVNPSGIIDNSNLLEYNYFTSESDETPFIKCIANYNSNIGDPLCCNQPGTVTNTKYICPQEVPECIGYSKNTYGYCT